jgi:hypothetical protein
MYPPHVDTVSWEITTCDSMGTNGADTNKLHVHLPTGI